eukprot:TRINITY_DN545_c0_g1_i1.p1 TRINITY_DN545_c0_g1~~TRINITY_DN545_c0_g1_i1.p1  ORF type:complete len:393 (-),score=105.03 TRINITY_DN545_c0_g1_i1:82-1260(-)
MSRLFAKFKHGDKDHPESTTPPATSPRADHNPGSVSPRATAEPTTPRADDSDSGDEYQRDVSMGEFLSKYVKIYATTLSTTHGNPSKLPYPMEFYLHKTILGMVSDFKMDHISLLNSAGAQADPLQRFLCVVQYWISTVNVTKFPYKPFFPRLGESLEVYTRSPTQGITTFTAEEMRIDPAFTAYHIHNATTRITQTGTLEMVPTFKTSRIEVKFVGPTKIHLEAFNEHYVSDWPAAAIYLLKGGTQLSGEATMTCAETGYKCVLTFEKKKRVHGHITHNGAPIFEIEGQWDGAVQFHHPGSHVKEVLIDRSTLAKDHHHNPPDDVLPHTATQKIRGKLMVALHNKDYDTAKAEKMHIEEFSATPSIFAPKPGSQGEFVLTRPPRDCTQFAH